VFQFDECSVRHRASQGIATTPVPNSKKSAKSCKVSAVEELDALMPLLSEHCTQRAVWTFRLLLKQHKLDALNRLGLERDYGLVSDLDERPAPVVRAWLERRLAQLAQAELAVDTAGQNAAWLGQRLGLSVAEQKVLAFAATVEVSEAIQHCIRAFVHGSATRFIELLAKVLDEAAPDIRASVSHRSTLVRAGIVRFQPGKESRHDRAIELGHPFDQILAMRHEQPEDLVATLCPRASAAERGLTAFSHVSRDARLIELLLRGAHLAAQRGINVLLYGPPGSGKSQLARSLAAALGLPLHQVPDVDVDGDALKGTARLNLLSLMQSLLQASGPGLVLFDEIEDAFPWESTHGWLRQASGKDKARTNRLLEENAVPCLWVGNHISHLDPAFLRRFSLVVEVPAPSQQRREAMLAEYSENLAVPAEVRRRLAEQPWLVPADIARAATVTRLVQRASAEPSGASQLPLATAASELSEAAVFERVLSGARRSVVQPTGRRDLDYDPGLVNASISLTALARGLKESGEGAICLYGPPGTGKTAFARQLATAVDRPFLHRSAGDLLDLYVGGTEKAIADMFDEAERSGSVLLLDEAEGLFRPRCAATRGYEVTQVNELLVRMEAFRGIFLCATNSFDALDAAALRRFALRVEFLPLSVEQHLVLFERVARRLGMDLPADTARLARDRLSRSSALTPGDYAACLRGRLLLGATSLEELLCDLERAHAEKRGERRMGFRA
jgi:AAA+ superfamily predicted ATPase